MEEKTFFTVESSSEFGMTVATLDDAFESIRIDYEEIPIDEIEDVWYTITPNKMTQEEFDNLPEFQ